MKYVVSIRSERRLDKKALLFLLEMVFTMETTELFNHLEKYKKTSTNTKKCIRTKFPVEVIEMRHTQ